jgi:tetratricopeptide (TPR) repeat protein
MMLVRTITTTCLAALLLAGCGSDPEAAKREAIAQGDRYLSEGKTSEAVIEYSRALQKVPSSSEAYERLGRVYLQTGNKLKAWQSYQRAANLAPDNLELQVQAGGVLLLSQRFDDARVLADGVLGRDPRHVGALVLRANALVGLENIDTAITMMRDAITMAPDRAQLYSNLGSLQATSGQVAEAEATYKKAIEVAPNDPAAHLPMGNFYWAVGQPAKAEQAFLKALSLDPNHELTHRALATFYLGSGLPLRAEKSLVFLAEKSNDIANRIALGDYYLVTGRPDQGLAILRDAATRPNGEAEARTRIAAYTYVVGRSDDALTALDEVLAKFPNHAPALLLKARFVLAKGRHDEAIRLATDATLSKPDYIEALYLLGQLHSQNGDHFQASQAYNAVLRINPMASPAQIELSRLLFAEGEPGSSKEYMDRVLRRAPEKHDTRVALIRALIERRDYRVAEVHLKELQREYPQSVDVQALGGTLAALQKDYASARRWYEAALRADSNRLDALSGLIGLDLTARRPAEALARARAAVDRAPGNVQFLMLLAKAYGATRDFERAEATLRQAIESHPDAFEPYGLLGQLLYERGRLAEGRAEFEKLLERRPKFIPAHTMIGAILRREGRTDEAIERYKQVLALDRESAVAANNLAWIYAERGVNLDEAVVLARTAKKKLPDVAEVTDTVGWVFYRNGSPDLLQLAVPMLEEAVKGQPGNPLFRYHLGAAYARSGRPEDARRELGAALKISPSFLGAAESRRILAALQ